MKFLAILFTILLGTSNLVLYVAFDQQDLVMSYHDVDRRANGNTLICACPLGEIIRHVERVEQQIPVAAGHPHHKVFEVSPAGEVVWSLSGLAYPHEVEEIPNGHLLVADTAYDRVIEVNYPGTEIVWNWQPALINWTAVNPAWGPTHYYNNNFTYDWTHVNDVDFKNYGAYNACLISLRNFDLVVEVNHTAEMVAPNDPANVLWWYGDYSNHTLLYNQHNPDYLASGNVIISDSENDRIVEVNKTTKAVEWVYDMGLAWPRDTDELPGGNILITDCSHNRVIEVDKETKQVVWSYGEAIGETDMLIPYEADLLANGHVLMGNGYCGTTYEVTRAGRVAWRHGIFGIRTRDGRVLLC